jgi:aminoglycoside phosphotransferase (APT) family kinase protein
MTTVDTERLDRWIGDRLPGEGERLTVEPLAKSSNEILTVSRGPFRWVLRKPPEVRLSATAHDVAREWRLLQALERTDVPHVKPLALCEDSDVIGTPFLLTELVDGFTPELPLPDQFAAPEARRSMGFELVDALAKIQAVDWKAVGLEGFGKPEGYLDRQVDRWLGQLETYRTRPIPYLDEVAGWLRTNRPQMGAPGLMHGDYQFRNVMFGHGLPPRIVAVIDWELATVGDPMVDLGWTLIRWFEKGEHGPEHAPGTVELTALAGMPTRAELVQRYADKTGRDTTHIDYYQTLALFKLAIIMESRTIRLTSGEVNSLAPDMIARAASLVGLAGEGK